MPDDENRPGGGGLRTSATKSRPTVPQRPDTDWADTFECAQLWVAWNGRRRWPAFAYNDDLWALSVAAWHHGGRSAS
jgi:hypothetical protein